MHFVIKIIKENHTAHIDKPRMQRKLVYIKMTNWNLDFLGVSDGKGSAYNAGDPGSIPGSGRSHGEGNGNPLQYSCLENPMDTVYRVANSWT